MIKSILKISVFALLFTTGIQAQMDYTVKFKSGPELPIENIDSYDQKKNDRNSEAVDGKIYRFIQFDHALSKSNIDEIEAKGIKLFTFVPTYTYLASIPEELTSSDLKKMDIRSIWKMDSDKRLHSSVSDLNIPKYSKDGKNALLILTYFEDLDFDLVANKLLDQDIAIKRHNGYDNVIYISIPEDRAGELADLPYVSQVSIMPKPAVKEDRRGRSLHRVNRLNPNTNNAVRAYTGEGIGTLVRDDGALFNHPDFTGRINQDFVGESRGSHGDGVGGIMAGAGNLDPLNQGMAYGSDMYVIDYEAGFQDETMSLFFNRDVIVTNSSYSDGCNDGYTITTEIVDKQVYDNPTLLHVFSAGNSGQGTFNSNGDPIDCGYGAGLAWGNVTGGHKIGKNVIATANLDYRGEIRTSSSRGPSRDGRIKPDIAANGHDHVSTNENYGYFDFGGTSGAAPVVAGVSAMLHQAYEDLNDSRANSALLKAVMLNTANDMGTKGPDFIFGWGSLNAHKAALLLEENRYLQAQINQDENLQHVISVPENVAEVRIMTYWPDPEASQFSGFTLLNDINSSVTGPEGTEHLCWFVDPSPNGEILADPARKVGGDFINNMEQVAIDNPVSGDYTLDLSGFQIPFGVTDYYVVWEFRMNEIDIAFPQPGDNLRESTTQVLHWDAEGNEGEFEISLIKGDGSESVIATVDGDRRIYEWFVPNGVDEGAKIKITRDGISTESEAPFLVADVPKFLDVDFDEGAANLNWIGVDEAVSYNIYALGEKYMEKVTTVKETNFDLPNEAPYVSNWLAVSANFENGSEGHRSIATASTAPPVAEATNSVENKACVNQAVVFETQTAEDPADNYSWYFGANAIPEESDERGPHNVIFTTKGNALSGLTIANTGGSDDVFFVMNIKDVPDDGDTEITKLEDGEYQFKTNMKAADTYTWDFGDGNSAEGKTVTHTYLESGNYEVKVVAENRCGTQSNSDDLFVDLVNAVGDLTIADFAVSPNPNNGNFAITLPDLEGNDLMVKLLQIDGKIVNERIIAKPNNGRTVSWQNIPSGIYLLKLNIDHKEIVEKIIVR